MHNSKAPHRILVFLFGQQFGWRWLAWGTALIAAPWIYFVECHQKCSALEVLFLSLSSVMMLFIILGVIAFQMFGGLSWLRCMQSVRKTRRQLDPIAKALEWSVKSRQNDNGSFSVLYSYEDGNYITILVSNWGRQVYTPDWNPGFKKTTPGFEVLLKAAQKICENPG